MSRSQSVSLELCLQVRLEAQRKAEQEKIRREMVRLEFWNLPYEPNFEEELKLTITPAGTVQKGGGECHTLGHPCRAGSITADSRRCVTTLCGLLSPSDTLKCPNCCRIWCEGWWLTYTPLPLQSEGSYTQIVWLCFRHPTFRRKLSSSCPSTSTTTHSIATYRSTSGYSQYCSKRKEKLTVIRTILMLV